MELVRAQSLTKIYGTAAQPVCALKDINLAIDEGEFAAIMGPSGSGKSTLMLMIESLIQGLVGSALALIILLPASLGLLNTLTINVLERTREIGIVRAVGGSQRQVRRLVTAEALLLGLFGAAIGVIAGLAMSYGFVAALGGALGAEFPYAFPLAGRCIASRTRDILVQRGGSSWPVPQFL